jgi:hypothetical protein
MKAEAEAAEAPAMPSVPAFAQRAAEEIRTYAQKDPGRAAAAAAGVFIAFQVIPTRWLIAGVAALARPALLTLGLFKAYELYQANFASGSSSNNNSNSNSNSNSDERAPKRPRH